MGELLTQLKKENLQAMRDKDTLKKGVLSLLISSIALAEKEGKTTLPKEEELIYVQKVLKQVRESLAETPADRPELVEETKSKISLIESYLPKQLDEKQIEEAIEAILSEKGLPKEKKSQGIIMKEMMAKYKGQTDGKTVNAVLAKILQ